MRQRLFCKACWINLIHNPNTYWNTTTVGTLILLLLVVANMAAR